MQVNFNAMRSNNPMANVSSMNRGIAESRNTDGAAVRGKNKDRVTISPQGKMMNAIENLMKQKENIVERKSDLIGRTLEKGKDLKSIENQLDNFQEQLNNIDRQIAQIAAGEVKKAAEIEEKKKPEKSDENKTDEEAETEKLSNLATATDNIKQAKAVSSVKSRVDGEIRVEKAQIKTDELKIDVLESRGKSGNNVAKMITHIKGSVNKKEAEVSDLQDKLQELGSAEGQSIKNASDKLEENQSASVTARPEHSEKAEAPERLDSGDKPAPTEE